MACKSSTTYLLTGLLHAGPYNYMKWFVNRLTGPRLMSLRNA